MLFFFLGGVFSVITKELTLGSGILLMAVTFFFGSLAALQLFSKICAAEWHLRSNPNATSRLTGELNNKGLQLKSGNRMSWQPHNGLIFCIAKNNQLSLCHDPRGEAVKILPIRGFRDPIPAIRFLEFQANKVSHSLNMLEPFKGPSMLGDQSAEAIAFGGALNGGDLKRSPLETLRLRRFRRTAIFLLIFNAVLLPVIFLNLDWLMMPLIGGALFLYDLLAVINILRSFLTSTDPEVPLIAIQGWLDEQQIALLHNVGQSLAGWKDFKSIGVNEACIWLEPYGGKNRFVLLPRRFFADDTQWQTAARIAATYSTE